MDEETAAALNNIWRYCEERLWRIRVQHTRKTNNTYKCIYKHYCKWLQSALLNEDLRINHIAGLPEGVVFITQHNVEAYYTECVVHMDGGMDCVHKKFTALKWWLKNVENRPIKNSPGTGTTIKKTPMILEAITQQQANYNDGENEMHAGSDPHKGLKDLLSEEEIARILEQVWARPDYADLAFSYLWGKNAGVRGASSRKFLLSDLNLSRGFGPEREAPRNRTLLLILRKGKKNKDKHNTDRQVGCQRHRNYLECSIFATAVLVIMKLRNLEGTINFCHNDKKKRADWWEISLNDFQHYHTESNAMRQVLRASGVDSCKVTHHRTQAVQYAGSKGLRPDQVSSFTKHMVEKLFSAYLPEVDEETMKVMSGFRKDEPRFVKEEHVVLPGNRNQYIEECIDVLIPRYKDYVGQQKSALGDKSKCAETFLYDIIPFLVETVVQDGIYFLRDHPLHPFSQLLKVRKK